MLFLTNCECLGMQLQLSEHFTYPNTLRSQRVWITEVLLYVQKILNCTQVIGYENHGVSNYKMIFTRIINSYLHIMSLNENVQSFASSALAILLNFGSKLHF